MVPVSPFFLSQEFTMKSCCSECGLYEVGSHHRCSSDDLMKRVIARSDHHDIETPSDELRLAEGFSMMDDEYYS